MDNYNYIFIEISKHIKFCRIWKQLLHEKQLEALKEL